MIPPEPRILFFGFSVTAETNGYAAVAKALLEQDFPSARVDTRAIGGAAINVVPFLNDLLSFEKYDVVLLEIATCLRFASDSASYQKFIVEIVSAVTRGGAVPLFLNLFRQGVDYSDDQLSAGIEAVALQIGADVVDLAPELSTLSVTERQLYLRDGIHTTDAGNQFYGQRAFEMIRTALERGNLKAEAERMGLLLPPPPNKHMRLLACTAPDELERREFSRSGIKLPVVIAPEGTKLTLRFSAPVKIRGFLVVTGPWNAWMSICVPGASFHTRRHVYDDRCYYDHFKYVLLPSKEDQVVTLEVLSDPPEVSLIKGEEWTKSRRIEVAGVFVEGDAVIQEIKLDSTVTTQ